MCFLLLFWPKSLDAVAMATQVELDELTLDLLFYMTINTVSKFHQNPSRGVKWFLYNSLHIYRESLKDTDLDTAAQATRASSVNNLTSYF